MNNNNKRPYFPICIWMLLLIIGRINGNQNGGHFVFKLFVKYCQSSFEKSANLVKICPILESFAESFGFSEIFVHLSLIQDFLPVALLSPIINNHGFYSTRPVTFWKMSFLFNNFILTFWLFEFFCHFVSHLKDTKH